MKNNKTMIYVGLVLGLLIFQPAFAGDKIEPASVAVSKDGNVVVAIHPYFDKNEKENFELGKLRKSVPIGVLVQNYGEKSIFIEGISVVPSSIDKNAVLIVPTYSPYGKRPAGMIGGRDYFSDGGILGALVHNKYAAGKKMTFGGVNEIFYKPTLKPGESFYALAYLEKRGARRHFPSSINNIDNLTLNVTYRNDASFDRYSARLPLNGSVDGIIEPAKIDTAESKFKCVHESCNKIDGKTLYDVNKALLDCYARSVAENGKIVGNDYGACSSSLVMFNKKGDYLSHEILRSSKRQDVSRTIDAVSKGMAHCDIPYSVGSADNLDKPYYGIEIFVGDVAMIKKNKDLNEK